MLPEKIENALLQAERQSVRVAAALASGNASAVQESGGLLRDMAVLLSQQMHALPVTQMADPQLKARLKRLSGVVASQRDGLSRRSAAVDRTLNILIPATAQSHTYGGAVGAYVGSGRRVDAFKASSA